jgi:hypothetical protein
LTFGLFVVAQLGVAQETVNLGSVNLQRPDNNTVVQGSIDLTLGSNLSFIPKDVFQDTIFLGIPTPGNIFSRVYVPLEEFDKLRGVCQKAKEWMRTAYENNVTSLQKEITDFSDIFGYFSNWGGMFDVMTGFGVFLVKDGKRYLVLLFQTTQEYNSHRLVGTQVILTENELNKFSNIISKENIAQYTPKLRNVDSLFN